MKASPTTTINVSGQKPVSHIITVRDRGEVSCDWLRAEKRSVFSRKVVFLTYEVFTAVSNRRIALARIADSISKRSVFFRKVVFFTYEVFTASNRQIVLARIAYSIS